MTVVPLTKSGYGSVSGTERGENIVAGMSCRFLRSVIKLVHAGIAGYRRPLCSIYRTLDI